MEANFVTVMLIGAVALVAALWYVYRLIMRPPDADGPLPGEDEPVVILDGATEMEAEVVRGKLESRGLRAYIRNSIAPTLDYRPVYGWEVLVRYGDVDAAQRCLATSSSNVGTNP